MTWTLIRSWAKDKGYTIVKTKGEHVNNYNWHKTDDPTVCGETQSLSKAATAIYNHMTDNKWVEHQKEHQERISKGEIDYEKGLY